MHSDKISLSTLHVCFTDIFRGIKQPQNAILYKKKNALVADISSDFWLIRILFFLKSPNCHSSSLNAKVVSEFFLQALGSCIESVVKVMVKSCKLSPRINTTLFFSAEILWEKDSFLQREAAQCVQKNHIYPSAKVLYASAVLGPDLPLHANISKEKLWLFQISGEICFSKSAKQADQICFHLYWAWT